jgi:hypothetical protein
VAQKEAFVRIGSIEMSRVISWFSCGAASAWATKVALKRYPDLIPVYCDTGSEHPDNKRFLKDCEIWFQRPITILKSEKYNDIWEVFESGYLVGQHGAKCTTELKKKVRNNFEQIDDLQIFGFDVNEQHRALRFKDNNPEVEVYFPLIDHAYDKAWCLEELQKAKIVLPTMYLMGYKNNNCIGCVKGGAGYWNKIRRDFPEVFDRMAKMERKLGVSILRDRTHGKQKTRLYLDELKPGVGRYEETEISCGLFCGKI